jgi:hypothetical protein
MYSRGSALVIGSIDVNIDLPSLCSERSTMIVIAMKRGVIDLYIFCTSTSALLLQSKTEVSGDATAVRKSLAS